MKTNSITGSNIYNTQNNNSQKQSFRGIGSGFVVPLMDGIDRGGVTASFIIQDLGGSCIPRTYSGLHRNEDITGKLNYQEATEVALREFITGPSMFAIPIAILYGVKKYLGRALDVPMKHIEAFSGIINDNTSLLSKANVKDAKAFKADFYKTVFRNVLETSTNGLSPERTAQLSEEFAQGLIKIEGAKSKGLINNIRNKAVKGSREDLTAELVQKFLDLTKASKGDKTKDLFTASISKDGKVVCASKISTLFNQVSNYADDVLKSAGKKLKANDSKSVSEFVSGFAKKRIGGRFVLNLGLFASVIAFCSIVPKIYMRSKTFPGLNGLETQNNNNEQKAVNNENK